MSYIRSGSNPECLYIYGAKDGVWIHGGNAQKPKELPRYDYRVDQFDWDGLCKKFVDDDSVVVGGLTTGEHFKFGPLELDYKCVRPGEWRQVLSHSDGWEIEMWDVTWAYIVRRFEK